MFLPAPQHVLHNMPLFTLYFHLSLEIVFYCVSPLLFWDEFLSDLVLLLFLLM